jgi:hypothetical protein
MRALREAVEGMFYSRACLCLILLHLIQLLHRKRLAPYGTTLTEGAPTLKTRPTSHTMPNNSGHGTQSEQHAAHSGDPFTTTGPETPAQESHISRLNHAHLPIPPSQSPIQWIADMLDNFPNQACFELNRRQKPLPSQPAQLGKELF